jgi:asparagine synthase (glutamine-hydrolysing)
MCGISGVISKSTLSPSLITSATKIHENLRHRGPDGQGHFENDHVVFNHARLSIIDLHGGAQPLYNADKSIALLVNGEIYNHIEIREKLISEGVVFQTHSDCEVILHLYEKYGMQESLAYLRGMFAFALYDSNKQMLFLCRDRMGEKPLYVCENGDSLFFSSELRPLIQANAVPFELDPIAIDEYFHYHFVLEPKSPIKGVRKLPAAHLLSIHLPSWEKHEITYWNMTDSPAITGDPIAIIKNELDEIGKLIIRADVPVGVALSGGVDSSVVAAMAKKHYKGEIHAFSIGYEGRPECDERDAAKKFARHLGINFHEVELSSQNMLEIFPELCTFKDEPISDIAGYGYYAVAKAARDEGVPVLIQGQGADELFWGYPEVKKAVSECIEKQAQYNMAFSLWNCFKAEIKRKPDAWTIKKVGKWLLSFAGLSEVLKRYKRIHGKPLEQLCFYDMETGYQEAARQLSKVYSLEHKKKLQNANPAAIFTSPLPWQHIDVMITQLICQTYLQGNGINQADRLSMYSSVETRLPFVDHVLVEKVIGLRKSYPDYKLPPKFWLKKAVEEMVPSWVLNKPKRGFTPPVRQWYKQIFDHYGHKLQNGYLQNAGIISPEFAESFAAGDFSKDISLTLAFKVMVLELWCQGLSRDLAQKN